MITNLIRRRKNREKRIFIVSKKLALSFPGELQRVDVSLSANGALEMPFVPLGPFTFKTRRGRVTIFGAFLTLPLSLGISHYLDRHHALWKVEKKGQSDKAKNLD